MSQGNAEATIAAHTAAADWFEQAKQALKPIATTAAAAAAGAAASEAWASTRTEQAATRMGLALLLMRGLPLAAAESAGASRVQDVEREVSHGLQLQPLWMVPAGAVS